MSALIRLAGEVLPQILESKQGRKATMAGLRKAKEGLGSLGSFAGRATEGAVRSGAPAAAEFAAQFAAKKGPLGAVARGVANASPDQVDSFAQMAGRIANPVAQGVGVLGTGAVVEGVLTKPDTAYSLRMDEIAAREASEYGIVDAKLQADAERQLGNSRLAEQKFQQALFLQEQRQQHDQMMAQARAGARTPRNQPMSGSGLFDPMSMMGSLSQNYEY